MTPLDQSSTRKRVSEAHELSQCVFSRSFRNITAVYINTSSTHILLSKNFSIQRVDYPLPYTVASLFLISAWSSILTVICGIMMHIIQLTAAISNTPILITIFELSTSGIATQLDSDLTSSQWSKPGLTDMPVNPHYDCTTITLQIYILYTLVWHHAWW